MLKIAPGIAIQDDEVELRNIRAQGPGGQNVNKVASAVHLFFDIGKSSLPQRVKNRLLALKDKRISASGVVIIKAQMYRRLERNRESALARLVDLVQQATREQRRRIPTKPSLQARKKRVDSKTQRGKIKKLRTRVEE